MNRIRISYTVVFVLLVAALAFGRPQDEPKSHEPSAPAQQQPEARPEGPEKQESAKPEKSEKENAASQEKQSETEKQERNKKEESNPASKSSDQAHGQPAGKGGHIPDDKFRAHFGRQHKFSVGRPTVINNQTTIVYSGYSFVLVDPWPVGWAYSDDVYIDYIDGEYFLFDLLHPGVRIALFVTM